MNIRGIYHPNRGLLFHLQGINYLPIQLNGFTLHFLALVQIPKTRTHTLIFIWSYIIATRTRSRALVFQRRHVLLRHHELLRSRVLIRGHRVRGGDQLRW